MTENTGGLDPHRTAKAEAKAAKAYAKATRPWYKKKRTWAAGVVLVAIAGSVAGGGGSADDAEAKDAKPAPSNSKADSGESKETNKAEAKSESAPKPMNVQAAAILKEFEGNEAAADIKYKGKSLQVTGEVAKVDTEFLDDTEYVIQVNGGGDFEFTSVNCNDQAPEDVANIKIGQQITVVGEFDDGGDLGVELKDCNAL